MLTEGVVAAHERLGGEEQRLRRLVLNSSLAQTAKPGQFVAVQVQDSAIHSFDPLLRRPISLAEISPERDEITLIYRIQGRGTEILAQARCGERLSVMGPLGKGFSLPETGEVWLVAGGLGVFPLYPLAQRALVQGLAVRLFWGGEDRSFLESAGLAAWGSLGIPVYLSTLDGSLGEKGLVTKLLEDQVIRSAEGRKKDGLFSGGGISIATCGPRKMMQAVTEWAAGLSIPVQVSLEERMGCTVGACLGCICTVREQGGAVIRKKVCQDGPVFRGEEVVWDESC